MKREEVLQLLVSETMAVLEYKKKVIAHGPRVKNHPLVANEATVRRFINSHLVEEDSQVFFIGEYKYTPEKWRTETFDQRKKAVNYITYKNVMV